MTSTPLAGSWVMEQTQQRLRTVRPEYPHLYAVEVGVPGGDGWVGLDDAVGGDLVTHWWRATLGGEAAGINSVAALRVIGTLAHAVLGRLTASLVLDRRAHDVSAANLALRLDADGHGDRVAVRDATVAVLPDDAAADFAGTEVQPGLPALLDRAAGQAVATLAPVLDEVRAASRFGIVPAWNAVADSVLGTATLVPLYLGRDERTGRALGEALLDALVDRGARIRTRGTCEGVWREGVEFGMPVRGSCCFRYRTDPPIDQPGDQYCTTCPLLAGAIRMCRFGLLLDEYVLRPGSSTRRAAVARPI